MKLGTTQTTGQNCSASRPKIEGQTNEATKEVQTETLSIKATPLSNGMVKAKTGNTTNTTAYAAWYDEVYIPSPRLTTAALLKVPLH